MLLLWTLCTWIQLSEGSATQVITDTVTKKERAIATLDNLIEEDALAKIQGLSAENRERLNQLLEHKDEDMSLSSHRNLSKKIVSELAKSSYTKPNKHNGIRVLLVLFFTVLIIGGCMLISRKMRSYIEQDTSVMITQCRKGKMELYTGQRFYKLKEDIVDCSNVSSLRDEK